VHAIPFAARQLADMLLLLVAAEVEPSDIAARRGLVVADLDDVLPPEISCPRSRVVELVARLVDVGDADRRSRADRAASGFSVRSAWNSVVLPAPFGPMMPTIAPAGA
jgi:hypothetical protein